MRGRRTNYYCLVFPNFDFQQQSRVTHNTKQLNTHCHKIKKIPKKIETFCTLIYHKIELNFHFKLICINCFSKLQNLKSSRALCYSCFCFFLRQLRQHRNISLNLLMSGKMLWFVTVFFFNP